MRLIGAHTEKQPPIGAVFPNHIAIMELADGRVQIAIRGSVEQAPGAAPKITQARITLKPAEWASLRDAILASCTVQMVVLDGG